jgi:hypothetical protein
MLLKSTNALLVNAGSAGTRYLVPSWSAGILAWLYNTQINGVLELTLIPGNIDLEYVSDIQVRLRVT